MKKKKWYKPSSVSLGWSKDDSQTLRRKNALSSRKGDFLACGRALMSLANIHSGKYGDKETERKARSDALYFFRQHRKNKVK